MGTIRLIDVEDERIHKALEWLIKESKKQDYGEISITVKRYQGETTAIEKVVKLKEKD